MKTSPKDRCKIMGFDVNPASNKPVIRETASMHNDGGAGNLGYFEQGGKKEKKQAEESIFSHSQETDSFSKESDKDFAEDDFSISKIIAKIILATREWFAKLFK